MKQLVKPAPDRTVPDPERGGLLADAGRVVDVTEQYWARRIRDNDVIVEDEVQASAQTTKPTKKA